MRVPIVCYGYTCWKMQNSDDAVKFLGFLVTSEQVSKDYVGGKYVYTPKEEVKHSEITLEFVPEELVRDLTPKEVENKELASLKNSLTWKETELKTAQEKIKALECDVQALAKP